MQSVRPEFPPEVVLPVWVVPLVSRQQAPEMPASQPLAQLAWLVVLEPAFAGSPSGRRPASKYGRSQTSALHLLRPSLAVRQTSTTHPHRHGGNAPSLSPLRRH
jgi:hypothetical protein